MNKEIVMVKGFIVVCNDGKKVTEDHYAVLPSGKVLVSGGHRLNGASFGPANPDKWGHASNLPAHAEFSGNYHLVSE